jgi:hypothetical protein
MIALFQLHSFHACVVCVFVSLLSVGTYGEVRYAVTLATGERVAIKIVSRRDERDSRSEEQL